MIHACIFTPIKGCLYFYRGKNNNMQVSAFLDHRRVSSGELSDVEQQLATPGEGTLLLFEDATGNQIDFNPGHPVSASQTQATSTAFTNLKPRKKGRPKLGVVSREVTLLPRHWDWLKEQPGGASAALRRLVDGATKSENSSGFNASQQNAAYRFMTAIAGDLPGYEDATRALFAKDAVAFESHIKQWPVDVRDYTLQLATHRPLSSQT